MAEHLHVHHQDMPGITTAAVPVDRSRRRERRLRGAVALNLVIVVAQVIAAIGAGSLGLLADAGHNLTDVAAVVASLIAVRLVRRAPTESRSFGMHRSTILAALANAAAILTLTVWIVFEGVRRLLDPEPVTGWVVLVVAGVAALANTIAAVIVHEPHDQRGVAGRHDLNMRSAMLHLVSDAAASAGVAVAGLVMLVTDGNYWLDPAISLVIAVLIAVQAWNLLRASTGILLEGTPTGLVVDDLRAAMAAVDGVEAVHDLHVWSLSSDLRALSAHIVLDGHPTLEEAQVVGDRVKTAIGLPFAIAHATLELECESCEDPCGVVE